MPLFHPVLVALLFSVLFGGVTVRAQDPVPNPDTKLDFISGNVVELPEGKMVVSRSGLGKASEKRTFLMKPDTKVEGKLKVKARVTVGYSRGDDGDTAVQVIVRDSKDGKDSKSKK